MTVGRQVKVARRWVTLAPMLLLSVVATATPQSSFVARVDRGFEQNQGQTDARALYLARAIGYTAFITGDGVAIRLGGRGVSITFRGAHTVPLVGRDAIPGTSNYMRSTSSVTGVQSFRRVIAPDLYPGIDLQYRFADGSVVFDLIAHPNADLSAVRLDVSGAAACVDQDGDLVIDGGDGYLLKQLRPVVYQAGLEGRHAIAATYTPLDDGAVGLDIGPFDESRDLVVDPALVYATYINGAANTDNAYGIYVDASRNIYVTGDTASTDFPTIGSPVYGTYRGGNADAFVIKYAPDGTRIFATFLGGTESDRGYVVTADDASNVYVAGTTFPGYNASATPPGPTFPFTPGAFKTYPYPNAGILNGTDIFVARLNPSGSSLDYAAHIAGAFSQQPTAILVDGHHNVYLAGDVTSPTAAAYKPFPTTPGSIKANGSEASADGAAWTTTYDGFVLELNSFGSSLMFSTLFGGQFDDHIEAMGVDSAGAIWIAGRTQSVDLPVTQNSLQPTYQGTVHSIFLRDDDGFLAKLNSTGTQVLFCSYLGTTTTDRIHGLAVDKDDSVYVVGETAASSGFPVTQNVYKTTGSGGFLAKFSSGGAASFITLTGGDSANAVSVNGGLAYVAGVSHLTPIETAGADQGSNAGNADAFLQRFNAVGTGLEYSTYLGGSGNDSARALVTDAAANAYLAGTTTSSDFPTTGNAAQPSSTGAAGFVAKYVFDTDGDGLLDTWETNGIDIDGDGIIDLNLAALGANPNHKDLFVEIDYMVANDHTHRPGYTPDENALPVNPIQEVVSAFANAPVANPDGQQGITLHVLIDEALTEQKFMTFAPPPPVVSDFKTIKNGLPLNPCGTGHFGTLADRASSNCANILKAKRLVYRYCIFAHALLDTSVDLSRTGTSEGGGNDFTVTLRVKESAGTDWEQHAVDTAKNFGTTFEAEWTDMVAGVFMHELGHTLGLQHGGGLGIPVPADRLINLKPNYLSVMNYSRIFNVAGPNVGSPTTIIRTNRALDYSGASLPTLDEASLYEPIGIGGPTGQFALFGQGTNGTIRVAPTGGAIDWNGENDVETAPVVADVNFLNLFQGSMPSAGQTLQGHDDWSNLIYSFRGSSSYGDGPTADTAPIELSDVDVSAFLVGELPPTVALVGPSDGQHFASGVTIALSATASDPDGTVQKVQFLDGGALLGSSTTIPYSYNWTGVSTGTHILSARAIDDRGGMASSAPHEVHVGCDAELDTTTANNTAEGGAGTIALTIAPGCAWNATSDQAWAALDTVTGTGSATLTYHVDANPTAAPRSATVNVEGQSFTITQDAATAFGAPSNVVAAAVRRVDGSFYVRITWNRVASADHYEIVHSTDGTTYSSDGVSANSPFGDDRVLASRAYLFKVRAVKEDGTTSAYSQPDLATTVIFTDDPLVAGLTPPKASHVTELRAAINLVRTLASLSTVNWAETVTAGLPVKASHVTEMRSALDAARSVLSLPAITYTDPALSGGAPIKAVHITQLRSGVK